MINFLNSQCWRDSLNMLEEEKQIAHEDKLSDDDIQLIFYESGC